MTELNKGGASDQAAGQVLRYMRWVRHDLAERGRQVKGIAIAREVDEGLRYAVADLPNVDVTLYRVSFELLDAPNVA